MKNFYLILSLIIATSLHSMEINKLITDKTLEHYKVFTDLTSSVPQMLRSCDFGRIPLTDGIPWMLTRLQNRYIKTNTLAKLLLCPKILETLNEMYAEVASNEELMNCETEVLEEVKEYQNDWEGRKELLDRITEIRRALIFAAVQEKCPKYKKPSEVTPGSDIVAYQVALIFPNRFLDEWYFNLIVASLLVEGLASQVSYHEKPMDSIFNENNTETLLSFNDRRFPMGQHPDY